MQMKKQFLKCIWKRLSWLYDDVDSSFDSEDELEYQIEKFLGYEHWN